MDCLYVKSPIGYKDGNCSWNDSKIYLYICYKSKPFTTDTSRHWWTWFSCSKFNVFIIKVTLIGIFHSFKMNLSKVRDGLKLLAFFENYASMNKTNFTAIFMEALVTTICLTTIKNSFRKSVIHPYNPDAIEKSCLMPTINTTHSSKTPNETEKEGIMPITVDEFPKYHSNLKTQSTKSRNEFCKYCKHNTKFNIIL